VNFLKRLSLLVVSGLLISSLANAQDGRARTWVVAPPQGVAQPSSVDVINKQLNPGPSDPNVPLPQAGLGQRAAEDPALQGSAFYGRKEENGALLGFRVPIPADRTNTATH
jgi:hypothetical protein